MVVIVVVLVVVLFVLASVVVVVVIVVSLSGWPKIEAGGCVPSTFEPPTLNG